MAPARRPVPRGARSSSTGCWTRSRRRLEFFSPDGRPLRASIALGTVAAEDHDFEFGLLGTTGPAAARRRPRRPARGRSRRRRQGATIQALADGSGAGGELAGDRRGERDREPARLSSHLRPTLDATLSVGRHRLVRGVGAHRWRQPMAVVINEFEVVPSRRRRPRERPTPAAAPGRPPQDPQRELDRTLRRRRARAPDATDGRSDGRRRRPPRAARRRARRSCWRGRESPSLASGAARAADRGVGRRASARCELAIGNWGPRGGGTGFLYFDRRDLDFGKDLEVRARRRHAVRRAGSPALEGRVPGGQPPDDRAAGRGPPPGPPDDAAHPHVREPASDADARSEQIASDHGLDRRRRPGRADAPRARPGRTRATSRSCATAAGPSTRRCGSRTARSRSRAHARPPPGGRSRSSWATATSCASSPSPPTSPARRTEVAVGGWDVAGQGGDQGDAPARPPSSPSCTAATAGAAILERALGARTRRSPTRRR